MPARKREELGAMTRIDFTSQNGRDARHRTIEQTHWPVSRSHGIQHQLLVPPKLFLELAGFEAPRRAAAARQRAARYRSSLSYT